MYESTITLLSISIILSGMLATSNIFNLVFLLCAAQLALITMYLYFINIPVDDAFAFNLNTTITK